MRKKRNKKLLWSLFVFSLTFTYSKSILCCDTLRYDDKLGGDFERLVIHQAKPHDEESDLSAFIKKLRISEFSISNQLDRSVQLTVEYVRSDKLRVQDQKATSELITLNPMEVTALSQRGFILSSIDLIDRQPHQYLNPKFPNGKLNAHVENTQDKKFFHQKRNFDFIPQLFSDNEIEDPLISEEKRKLRKDFNDSYNYVKYAIVGDEELEYSDFYEKRRDLYNQNNIQSLLSAKANQALFDSATYKIPLITHKIWITSGDSPRNPDYAYVDWLENSIQHNKIISGWQHNFWVEKEKLPNFCKHVIEHYPNIILRDLTKMDTRSFITGDLYKKLIIGEKKRFGAASDIVRLELLLKFGGFYLDTDYELFHSLKPYAKAYDMILGLEPMSVYLGNAFIGARRDHPVVMEALRMINRNFSDNAPNYVKRVPANDGFKTIVETGPIVMTAAFARSGGQAGCVDIVLPPQVLYPAVRDKYPEKQIPRPGEPVPAEALGIHYWDSAWANSALTGSHG